MVKCARCSNQAIPGKVNCGTCAAAERKRQAAKRKKAREENVGRNVNLELAEFSDKIWRKNMRAWGEDPNKVPAWSIKPTVNPDIKKMIVDPVYFANACGMQPHDYAIPFMQSKYIQRMLRWGRGTGKTYHGSMDLLWRGWAADVHFRTTRLMKRDEAIVILIAQREEQAEKMIYYMRSYLRRAGSTMADYLEKEGTTKIELGWPSGRGVTKFLTAPTGPKGDSARGEHVDAVGVDELESIDRMIHDYVLEHIKSGRNAMIVAFGTPKGRTRWMYPQCQVSKIMGAQKYRPVDKVWAKDQNDVIWEQYYVSGEDAPHITDAYKAKQKRTLPKVVYDQEVRALFVDTAGVFFTPTDIAKGYKLTDKAPVGLPHILSLDVASQEGEDDTVISDIAYRRVADGNETWLVKQSVLPHHDYEEVAAITKEIADTYRHHGAEEYRHTPRVVFDGTGIGGIMQPYLNAVKVKWESYNWGGRPDKKFDMFRNALFSLASGLVHLGAGDPGGLLRTEMEAIQTAEGKSNTGRKVTRIVSAIHDDRVDSWVQGLYAIEMGGGVEWGSVDAWWGQRDNNQQT